jgi:hypothetical protein
MREGEKETQRKGRRKNERGREGKRKKERKIGLKRKKRCGRRDRTEREGKGKRKI